MHPAVISAWRIRCFGDGPVEHQRRCIRAGPRVYELPRQSLKGSTHPTSGTVGNRMERAAVTGAVISATRGWYWLDPAVALVIAAVIGYHALTLIRPVLVAIKTHAAQGLLFRRQLQQHLCNSFGS
jgi:hypothetical protein